MNSENREPPSEHFTGGRRPASELWEPWEWAEEPTQPLVSRQPAISPGQEQTLPLRSQAAVDPQPSYREHVSGSLVAHPAEAPLFQPAYVPPPPQLYPQQGQAYASQPAYPGYYPYTGYPGYPAYGYPPHPWQPPQPQHRRDGYLLAMAITSLIGSSLALLIGLLFTGLLLLATTLPNRTMNANQQFTVYVVTALFICVGLFGGSFGLYHSIRSLVKKPSAAFALPQFWIFLVFYVVVIVIAIVLRSMGQEVAFPALSATLIVLAGVAPALAMLALGVRRLRIRGVKPQKDRWETTWRRITLAVLSGATLSVTLASVLELVLLVVTILVTHTQGMQNIALCVNTPDAQSCQNAGAYGVLFLTIAVVAPLVEETVKPLAVVFLIGRVRSAAEAFVLGLACGVGFDIVETSLYISSGYHDWLNVALIRTGASLLHGFGAAMVALGWYYLTHSKETGGRNALLLAFGCWLYAVFQHAVWNGSEILILLPGPVGHFLQNWSLNLGFATLTADIMLNIIVALLILSFFLYMTDRLRNKPTTPSALSTSEERKDSISVLTAMTV